LGHTIQPSDIDEYTYQCISGTSVIPSIPFHLSFYQTSYFRIYKQKHFYVFHLNFSFSEIFNLSSKMSQQNNQQLEENELKELKLKITTLQVSKWEEYSIFFKFFPFLD
jgi:hypothetical protein